MNWFREKKKEIEIQTPNDWGIKLDVLYTEKAIDSNSVDTSYTKETIIDITRISDFGPKANSDPQGMDLIVLYLYPKAGDDINDDKCFVTKESWDRYSNIDVLRRFIIENNKQLKKKKI